MYNAVTPQRKKPHNSLIILLISKIHFADKTFHYSFKKQIKQERKHINSQRITNYTLITDYFKTEAFDGNKNISLIKALHCRN